MKSIEIYYDIADIPGCDGHGNFSVEALDFRNEAMTLIEDALAEAGLGEWVGAESGAGEVNFGFDVKDFDAAEELIRSTVAGTKYEGIREIERREFDESEFEIPEDLADQPHPMTKFELLVFLVFRRLPKRFRFLQG